MSEIGGQSRMSVEPWRLLTPKEAATCLGISLATVYAKAERGEMPFRKVGRLLRFDPTELDEWTKQQAHRVDGGRGDR